MSTNNGGAIAQKGFNYQNHVISLVAIRNYEKRNFSIYVEADEDFEVTFDDDYHAYIQVKGQKISIKKLLARSNGKPCILEKNLTSGDDKSKYKIVVIDILDGDLKLLQEQSTVDEELFKKSYRLGSSHRDTIEKELGDSFNSKLDNFSLIKTDFDNNSDSARTYLKGELVNAKISVDGRDDSILNELLCLIQQKAEKTIHTEEDKQLKKISADDLTPLLSKLEDKERFKKELEQFGFTSFKKEKIEKEGLKIAVQYTTKKNELIEILMSDTDRLEKESLVSIAQTIISRNIEILEGLDENTKYAIIISAYCEIIRGIANE